MPGIPSGLIDQFLHPPLGALTNTLDGNSPYGPGAHTLTSWDDGGTTRQVQDTFGVISIVNGAIPPELGMKFGWPGSGTTFTGDEYSSRFVQIVVEHQLLFGLGPWIISDLFDQYYIAQVFLWKEALPGRIGLYVAPDIHMDLQFLRAL